MILSTYAHKQITINDTYDIFCHHCFFSGFILDILTKNNCFNPYYDGDSLCMKHKIRAFLTHLCISMSIFLIFLTIMFLYWYPQPFFKACNAHTVLSILIFTGLVLGPLLTLIIYKPDKPWLKLDLSLIALFQISAFIYGGNIIYQERPAYLVFTIDRFEIVAASDIDESQISNQHIFNLPYPRIVYTEMPKSRKERGKIFDSSLQGKDLERYPEYYSPIDPHTSKIYERSLDLELLSKKYPSNTDLSSFISRNNPKSQKLKFLPVRSKQKDMTAIISKNIEIIGFLDIPPWL